MNDLKNILMKIVKPHKAIAVIAVILALVLLLYPVLVSEPIELITIAGYAISAYALTVVCFYLPDIITWICNFKANNKLIQRYINDPRFRVKCSLYSTFSLNIAYAVLQLGLGIRHASLWYYSFSAYYVIISTVRFFLLKHTRAHAPREKMTEELQKYRVAGISLLVLNVALSAMIFYMLLQGIMIVHHEIVVIALAAYTFTSLTLAIVNLVKFRKYKSPLFQGVKAISLATALVSVITLENSMITVFGTDTNPRFLRLMVALTGGAVSAFIFVMSIYIIVTSTKELKANAEK